MSVLIQCGKELAMVRIIGACLRECLPQSFSITRWLYSYFLITKHWQKQGPGGYLFRFFYLYCKTYVCINIVRYIIDFVFEYEKITYDKTTFLCAFSNLPFFVYWPFDFIVKLAFSQVLNVWNTVFISLIQCPLSKCKEKFQIAFCLLVRIL